jgi:hypothetical protein
VKTKEVAKQIRAAIAAAKLERAEFGSVHKSEDVPAMKEKDVTAFIRERTRLYRESWIVGPLEIALEIIEKGYEA